jgi:hypothetical protein
MSKEQECYLEFLENTFFQLPMQLKMAMAASGYDHSGAVGAMTENDFENIEKSCSQKLLAGQKNLSSPRKQLVRIGCQGVGQNVQEV